MKWKSGNLRGTLPLLAITCGCASVIEYKPNENLISEISDSEASRRFKDALKRVVLPPTIHSVEITKQFFSYFQQGKRGMESVVTDGQKLIYFRDISRIQILNAPPRVLFFLVHGYRVDIWGPDDKHLAWLIFETEQDAKTWVDIVWSYRARQLN